MDYRNATFGGLVDEMTKGDHTELEEELRKLWKGKGAKEPGLGLELRSRWRIADTDDVDLVCAIVEVQLEWLIERLDVAEIRVRAERQERIRELQLIARVTYNVSIEGVAKMPSVVERREWLNEAQGISPKTSQRRMDEVAIPQLVQLLSDERSLPSRDEIEQQIEARSTNTLSNSSTDIPRKDLEEQFRATLNMDDGKIIAFIGLPGTGKSWIADEVTRNDRPKRCSWIGIDDRLPRESDVTAMLANNPVDLSSLPPHNGASQQLASALASENGPPMVVLDNLDTLDELEVLLPKDIPKSRVVVTARRLGTYDRSKVHIIDVGQLTEDQASQMVLQRLPSVSPSQVAEIATRLGHHPLVIDFVSLLMADFDLTLNDLRSDRHLHLIESMPLRVGGTFVAALERLTVHLKEHDQGAYTLLLAMVFLYPGIISDRAHYQIECVLGIRPGVVGRVERIRCLKILADFTFVSRRNDRFELHPLVFKLLKSILSPSIGDVVRLVVKVLSRICEYERIRTGEYQPVSQLVEITQYLGTEANPIWAQRSGGDISAPVEGDPRFHQLNMYFLQLHRKREQLKSRFESEWDREWDVAWMLGPCKLTCEGWEKPWVLIDQYLENLIDESELDAYYSSPDPGLATRKERQFVHFLSTPQMVIEARVSGDGR